MFDVHLCSLVQFARFTALMAEIKRQMSSLADAHRQEQQQVRRNETAKHRTERGTGVVLTSSCSCYDCHAIRLPGCLFRTMMQSDASSASVAAQMQQSYLLFLELKAVSRQITNMAETTKAQVQNVSRHVQTCTLGVEGPHSSTH